MIFTLIQPKTDTTLLEAIIDKTAYVNIWIFEAI